MSNFPILPKEFDDPGYGHVVLNKWGATQYNWGGGGTGVIYIDDVLIVPEPATFLLLGLGALALRRKRRA